MNKKRGRPESSIYIFFFISSWLVTYMRVLGFVIQDRGLKPWKCVKRRRAETDNAVSPWGTLSLIGDDRGLNSDLLAIAGICVFWNGLCVGIDY